LQCGRVLKHFGHVDALSGHGWLVKVDLNEQVCVVLFSAKFNDLLPLIVERLLKCDQFNVFLRGHDELGIGFGPELLASPVKSSMRIRFKERKLVV
jgi:hypothetical protein